MEIGDRFGKLVVLSIEATLKGCYNRDIRVANLKYAKTKSCGCLQSLAVSNSMYDRWETDRRNDRVGQRQCMLTVIKRDYTKNATNIYWVCACDCGRQVSIPSHKLNGQARSCRACYLKGC